MADIYGVRQEIEDDPLARGYSGMTDLQVSEDGNTKYRPAPEIPAEAVRKYVIGTAKGTTNMPIYGRLVKLTDANVNEDPYGDGITGGFNEAHRACIFAFLALVDAAGGGSQINIEGPEFDNIMRHLGEGSTGCHAMTNDERNEILSLNQSQISRWEELGVGRVNESVVAEARAITPWPPA